MRITNHLAFQQLKQTCGRSISLILAIILSTALTTTLTHFVASGNALIISFLGPSYGDYKGTYTGMLLIPAFILSLVIIIMSVVVISNVFKISTQERIKAFGILKSVGATKEQILETVIFESLWTSIIGIPLGLVLGLGLTKVTTGVTNHFLEELNQLTQIMVNQFHLSFPFLISWKALVFSAVLSLVTVLFSAWLPARNVSKIPAIISIKGYDDSTRENSKKAHSKALKHGKAKGLKQKLIERLIQRLGPERQLAFNHLKRNHKQFKATTTALVIGLVLLICLSQLSFLAKGIESYMSMGGPENMIVDYSSARETVLLDDGNLSQTIIKKPIDSQLGSEIAHQLSQWVTTPVFGMGNDMETYHTQLSNHQMTEDMLAYLDNDQSVQVFDVEVITLDNDHYHQLCQMLNVPLGSNLLINDFDYNDFGKLVAIVPYKETIDQMTLIQADGKETVIPVEGYLNRKDMMPELFYPNMGTLRLIMPRGLMRAYTWYAQVEDQDINHFTRQANALMASYFPQDSDLDYKDLGFSTRVYQMDDYMKVMNIAVAIGAILLYSFSGILLLIGFTNVVTSLSTNVLMRSREFAVLQSVGMTPESLSKMINSESLICSIKALSIGIPLGLIISYVIQIPVRLWLPIAYHFPWITLVVSMVGIILITRIISYFAIRRLKKQNIIEMIRNQN